MRMSSDGNISVTNTLAMGSSYLRNRIINGAMVIDQRNAGASVTIGAGANTYTLDRWLGFGSQASKFSIQQNAGSVTSPAGFINYLGVTSSSAYTVGSSEQFVLVQPIEGLNITDLNWGTANAQTITLSFWVRSSLTGTFGGSLRNSAVNRSYPFSYTVSSTNTWEQKSITIAGDTTGTWLTTNGVGIYLAFGLGVGSTLSGTAGSWSAANYASATGATSVVGTNGATFYITGVQLEVGTVATPFERRLYGTELALCQRYLPAFIPTSTGTGQGPVGQSYAATNALVAIPFQVPARVFPTGISVTNATNFAVTQANTTRSTASAVNFNGGSPYGGVIDVAVASGLVAGSATVLWVNTLPCQILFTGCEL
jgi:hypothetical protein